MRETINQSQGEPAQPGNPSDLKTYPTPSPLPEAAFLSQFSFKPFILNSLIIHQNYQMVTRTGEFQTTFGLQTHVFDAKREKIPTVPTLLPKYDQALNQRRPAARS